MAVANAPASPLNLPQPPQTWNTGWQQRYTQALTQASQNYITRGNDILLDANTTFTLTSPDGTTQVTIIANDDGTIGPTPAAPADIRPQNNTWTGTNTFNGAVTVNATLTVPNTITANALTLSDAGAATLSMRDTSTANTWDWLAWTDGNFYGQGTTIGNWLEVTPASVTITAPTTTLNGTVLLPSSMASGADILSGTSGTRFDNPAADWAALAVVNLGGGTLCNMATGINFYTAVSSAPTITFSNLRSGQSGVVCVANTSGAAFNVSLDVTQAPPSMNITVNAGATAIFSYFCINNAFLAGGRYL